MINKKSLWFITLFSLILVLSVYYVTMPNELLLTGNGNYQQETKKSEASHEENKKENVPTVEIQESTALTALRVEADSQLLNDMEDLQMILTSVEATIEQKNNAFEKMKILNITKGEEEKLEKKLEEKFQLKSFVKIDGDQVRVVAQKEQHDTTLANNIMRTIQENFDKKMYISVKFQK